MPKLSLSDYLDAANLFVAGISLLVALAGIVIGVGATVWAVRRSEQVSSAQAPDMRLFLGAHEITGDLDVNLLLTNAGSPTVGFIPIRVGNVGTRTIEGLQVVLETANGVFVPRDSLKQKFTRPFGGDTEPSHSLVTTGNFTASSYAVGSLDPGKGVSLDEPVFARPTEFVQKVDATTKDGVPISASLRLKYSWIVQVSLYGKDFRPFRKTVNVSVTDAAANTEVLTLFSQFIHSTLENTRRQNSFWSYLGFILRGSKTTLLVSKPIFVKQGESESINVQSDVSLSKAEFSRAIVWRLIR